MRITINTKRQISGKDILEMFVFATLALSIIFVVVRLIQAPSTLDPDAPYTRLKSDYLLMLTQCLLGLFVGMLPGILSRRLNFHIPHSMHIMFLIFIYCAIYLGEVQDFYYRIPRWDSILHYFSGMMLGALGFSLITILNRSEKIHLQLSPAFIAIFAFCFSVTLGVIWEFYEYCCDELLNLNMQKTMLQNGIQLIGHAALSDTIKDLFVDATGAGLIAIIGYMSIKYDKIWIRKLFRKWNRNETKQSSR